MKVSIIMNGIMGLSGACLWAAFFVQGFNIFTYPDFYPGYPVFLPAIWLGRFATVLFILALIIKFVAKYYEGNKK